VPVFDETALVGRRALAGQRETVDAEDVTTRTGPSLTVLAGAEPIYEIPTFRCPPAPVT